LGHDEAEAHWLLRHAVRGTADRPYLAPDEYERLLPDLDRHLDAVAPARPGYLTASAAWNWDRPEQVKEAFAAVGVAQDSTEDGALAAVEHPLASLVRQRRAAGKLASTYGRDWLEHVAEEGGFTPSGGSWGASPAG
jgi:hypothetical protein